MLFDFSIIRLLPYIKQRKFIFMLKRCMLSHGDTIYLKIHKEYLPIEVGENFCMLKIIMPSEKFMAQVIHYVTTNPNKGKELFDSLIKLEYDTIVLRSEIPKVYQLLYMEKK